MMASSRSFARGGLTSVDSLCAISWDEDRVVIQLMAPKVHKGSFSQVKTAANLGHQANILDCVRARVEKVPLT